MTKRLKKIHWYYFMGILFLTFILFLPFYWIFTKFTRTYPVLNYCRKFHSLVICYLSGFIPKIHYAEKLDTRQKYIYCANHSSNLDIMMMCIMAKDNFCFMGKKELLNNIVLKIFFQSIDIPVDRKSIKSSFLAFKKADERIKGQMSVIIFPEGKIPDTYPPILAEFKNGPFKLAIENNISIVSISFQNQWQKMWDDGRKYGTNPGKCHIFVHPVISTENLNVEDTELLKDQVFQLIQSKLQCN